MTGATRAGAGSVRALVVLATAMVLAMSTWFSAAAVLPALRERWQLTDGQAPWLTIAVQIGFVVGAVVLAVTNLSDRIPPRRLVLVGGAGAAAANLGLLAVESFGPAVTLRVVTGAFLAGVYGPAVTSVCSWYVRGRGTAVGIMVGALTLGSALPHLVNGIGGADHRVVLATTSALTLLGGLLAELGTGDGPHRSTRAPFDPRAIGAVLRDRRYRLAVGGYLGHMWELYAMWTWFAVFAADVVEDVRIASLWTFAVIGIGAVGSWVAGLIGDHRGRTESAALSMIVSGSVAAVIGFLVDAPTALVVAVSLVWGFWVVADSAQFSTIVTELVPRERIGTAVTVQLAAGFVLSVTTIWLVPELRDALGWWAAFLLLAPGPALGTWAMARLRSEMAQVPGSMTTRMAPDARSAAASKA
ncbi:MAG: MFS transporter [Actinomycetota bacterium]